MVYVPTRRNAPFQSQYLIRADGDLLALARSAERELAALDGQLVLENATMLGDVAGQGLVGRQLPTVLIAAFGALALLLASVGVYAMFVSMVVAREGEFAVRMALGSRPGAVAGLVLKQGAGWMAAGLVGGVIGVAYVARLLRDLLYGVSPLDPLALGVAIAVLAVCATVALLIPLRLQWLSSRRPCCERSNRKVPAAAQLKPLSHLELIAHLSRRKGFYGELAGAVLFLLRGDGSTQRDGVGEVVGFDADRTRTEHGVGAQALCDCGLAFRAFLAMAAASLAIATVVGVATESSLTTLSTPSTESASCSARWRSLSDRTMPSSVATPWRTSALRLLTPRSWDSRACTRARAERRWR